MDWTDPPAILPPASLVTIPAGTVAWRVHGAARGAADLNATARPRVRVGGRFDSLDGSYDYIYLGDSPAAVIAETLCRNLPVDQSPRLIPHTQIAGRVLSELRLTRDVQVVDLTGTGSARINAGVWLTTCDPAGYLHTRRWAAAILAAHPDADGLQYRPRHDENTLAWMLTDGPTVAAHPAVHPIGAPVSLESAQGRYLLSVVLTAHNAALSPLP